MAQKLSSEVAFNSQRRIGRYNAILVFISSLCFLWSAVALVWFGVVASRSSDEIRLRNFVLLLVEHLNALL